MKRNERSRTYRTEGSLMTPDLIFRIGFTTRSHWMVGSTVRWPLSSCTRNSVQVCYPWCTCGPLLGCYAGALVGSPGRVRIVGSGATAIHQSLDSDGRMVALSRIRSLLWCLAGARGAELADCACVGCAVSYPYICLRTHGLPFLSGPASYATKENGGSCDRVGRFY